MLSGGHSSLSQISYAIGIRVESTTALFSSDDSSLSLELHGSLDEGLGQDFQRHVPVELGVSRPMHLPHAAFTRSRQRLHMVRVSCLESETWLLLNADLGGVDVDGRPNLAIQSESAVLSSLRHNTKRGPRLLRLAKPIGRAGA